MFEDWLVLIVLLGPSIVFGAVTLLMSVTATIIGVAL